MNYQNEKFFQRQSRQQELITAEAEYGFLVGRLLDRDTLRQAILTAESWGVGPLEVLLARGWITDEAYVEALADYLGVPASLRIGAQQLPGELILIDAACAKHRIPLSPRGGATGNYGECVPMDGGVVLDMAAFN